MKRYVVLYLPVLHAGYLNFLHNNKADTVYILDSAIIETFTPLARDLRKLDPIKCVKILESLGFNAALASLDTLKSLNQESSAVTFPDESEMHEISRLYLDKCTHIFESSFLRWDKTLTTTENIVHPDRLITTDVFHQKMIERAKDVAKQSPDWWRQVGAVLLIPGQEPRHAHNHHLPTDYHLAQNGDPRVNVDAGQRPDLYTSIHAEASLIAQAARDGFKTAGSTLYVTTFPCPNCARLISEAGVTEVYYEKGFSRLDGEQVLKDFGVKITLVSTSPLDK